MAIEDHNWPEVMAALQDWLEASRENAPQAVGFHAALETVISPLPDEQFWTVLRASYRK